MYITDLYEDDLEIAIKVVIVGNGAVGKSSMIQRYCRGIFTQNYKKTIGVDFLEKHLRMAGEEVRLMLWDTAGQEEFDAITKAYYRGAQACVVAFSTTDRASFDAVKKWKRKVEDECGQVPTVLVQNKIDMLHEAQVSAEEVENLAKELKVRLFRTSVKEDLNVSTVFQHLADNYVNRVKNCMLMEDLGHMSMNGKGLCNGGPNGYELHLRHQPVQIGGSRPYIMPSSNTATSATANGYNNKSNNNSKGKKHFGSGILTNSTQSSNNPYGGFYRRNVPQQQRNNRMLSTSTSSSTSSSSSSYGFVGGFSPQDYLNNPMFESLHSQQRRYWPAPTSDMTITLRPLSQLAKRNVGKKSFGSRGSISACKVL